jgi:sulfhydrogenase subunit delta
MAENEQKKLVVGFFSFTGCGGCFVEFSEILNSKYKMWAPLLDIKYCHLLQRKNVFGPMDVAFIEGGIATEGEVARITAIREKAKYMVAVGSCAITGAPCNLRNFFDDKTREEVRPVVERFKHRPKITGINDVVKVDVNVPGCPCVDSVFIKVMENYMREFGVLPPLPAGEKDATDAAKSGG